MIEPVTNDNDRTCDRTFEYTRTQDEGKEDVESFVKFFCFSLLGTFYSVEEGGHPFPWPRNK